MYKKILILLIALFLNGCASGGVLTTFKDGIAEVQNVEDCFFQEEKMFCVKEEKTFQIPADRRAIYESSFPLKTEGIKEKDPCFNYIPEDLCR